MKLSTAETINAVSNKTSEESNAMAESMATKFGAVQLLGVLIAPINGYIIDNSKFMFLSCLKNVCFDICLIFDFTDFFELSTISKDVNI